MKTELEKRFLLDVDKHKMTVFIDHEMYRHIRFSRPGDNAYSFGIMTWPGYLSFYGDMGANMFARERDMFGFFRGQFNPDYWCEKVQAKCLDGITEFDEDQFKKEVNEFMAYRKWPNSVQEIARSEIFDDPEQYLRAFEFSHKMQK